MLCYWCHAPVTEEECLEVNIDIVRRRPELRFDRTGVRALHPECVSGWAAEVAGTRAEKLVKRIHRVGL